MAADAYTGQANQYVKEIYAPRVVRLYPEANFLVKNIPFNAANRVGKQYVVPIELAPEQGVTYAAAGAGGFSLNGAQALSTQDAILQPAQIVVQRAVDYESIQRTVGSKAAFVSFIDATLRSVVALATKRLELAMLWGQFPTGLGQVASAGSVTGSGANAVVTLTLIASEWSGGLWGGMENAMVSVLSTTGGPGVASVQNGQRNGVTKFYQVKSISLNTQQITLQDVNSDGTLANIAANDIIVPFGGQTYSGSISYGEMVGLAAIAMNSSTLFNIAATYGLWNGNSITAWGPPSLSKILDSVSRLVERGLDEDVVVLVSPKHFARLNSDQTALRLYTDAGGTAKQGWQDIQIASENGVIKVRSHRFMKDGYVLGLPLSKCMRIGSTELTFTNMGVDGDIFLQTAGQAQVELRGYLGQAVLMVAPSRMFLGSGVTYP